VGTIIVTSSPDSITIIPKATFLRTVIVTRPANQQIYARCSQLYITPAGLFIKSFGQTDTALDCGDAPDELQHQ
jgi:hypothetical protein